MSSPAIFACQYCSRVFPSEPGHRSHVQQNTACRQTMLEAETISSSKNPKHRLQGEESIRGSEAEDTETSDDLQDDRSPSPHSNAYDAPGFPPEGLLDFPIALDASDSDISERRRVATKEDEGVDAPGQRLDEGEISEDEAGFEFIEDYPAEAGTPGPGRRKTPFEKLKAR